jgi:phage repressor protein C with HTH and peptisase S24 domain
MKQKEIWQAIDLLAKNNGVSVSALAKKAGLDPTSFNKSKRISPLGKPRWPSMESLLKLIESVNISFQDLLNLATNKNISFSQIKIIELSELKKNEKTESIIQNTNKKLSIAHEKGETFAIIINEDGFSPIYKKEKSIIVIKAKKTSKGDRILIKTRDKNIYIGDLVKISALKYEIITIPSWEIKQIGFEHIEFIGKVLWASQ